MSEDKTAVRPSPLNVSMDMESMEREMRNIYEELKQDGGKEIEDLDASSLMKSSRSATQMLAQIMGDLGPMLKDPMMQNHPLLAKYLAEEKERNVNEGGKDHGTPAQTKGDTSEINKNNESENEAERAKEEKEGGCGAKIAASPPAPTGEREEDVEVDKLIHLFVSGKKEKEKVISLPLRSSGEPRKSIEEVEATASAGVASTPSPLVQANSGAKAPAEQSEDKKDEKQLATGSSGRGSRIARDSSRKDTPTRKTRNPAMDKEMERIRRAVEEKKARRQREIMGGKAATDNVARLGDSSDDTPIAATKPEEAKGSTIVTPAADHVPATQDTAGGSRTPPMESSSGSLPTAVSLSSHADKSVSVSPMPEDRASASPSQQTEPQPTNGPVKLGTLIHPVSMRAVAMPAPMMAVSFPVPIPVPVPVEEDLPEGADTRESSDNGEEKATSSFSSSLSPRSVTFGPGKSAILMKQERAQSLDKNNESDSEGDGEKDGDEEMGEKEKEQKKGAQAKEERRTRPKADTVSLLWLRAAPKEGVKVDHRKSLLDRRITLKDPLLKKKETGSLKSSKKTPIIGNSSLTTTAAATAAQPSDSKEAATGDKDAIAGKAEEKRGQKQDDEDEENEDEEEEVEEDEQGKGEEEEEASEYEDGGSDDEKSGSGTELPGSGNKKAGAAKPLFGSSGDVTLRSKVARALNGGEGTEDEARERSKSSKDGTSSPSSLSAIINSPRPSPSTPARKDDRGASNLQTQPQQQKGEESGLKFSRFGSASLVSAKRTYKLTEGNNTMGRGDVQIVLKAASVSRKHATITLKNGTAFIRDLNSTHGTRVNDKLVTGKAPLAVGDSIKLGSIRLTFRVEDPILEGVLSKRSPAFHKSWQKRYCVLKKRQRDIIKLYYYRSKENRLPQGSVSMEQVVAVTDDENGGSVNVFKIKTIMRVFEFQAKDEEERNMWLKALREASGKTVQRMEADRKERQRAVVAGDNQESPFGSNRSGTDDGSSNDEDRTPPDVDRRKQTTSLPANMADLFHKGKRVDSASPRSFSSDNEGEEEEVKDKLEAIF